MGCDMCGADGQMFNVIIEGTDMVVCSNCSKYGKVKTRVKSKEEIKFNSKRNKINEQIKINNKRPEIISIISSDYAEKIKRAREKLKLKQEEVAKRIAEKESLLHNIESGNFEPSMKTAKKLENFFNIKLIERYEEKHKERATSSNSPMTLGDMIKIKKR